MRSLHPPLVVVAFAVYYAYAQVSAFAMSTESQQGMRPGAALAVFLLQNVSK
ncbi:unnamed protein product, partial [Nippostrongylus brasiliensis]|uniref:Secreted protein n=1 Tax=Nippostrongylus brasiliensis TaxID=27835 RepID=A0A0N4XFL0_NIPBR